MLRKRRPPGSQNGESLLPIHTSTTSPRSLKRARTKTRFSALGKAMTCLSVLTMCLLGIVRVLPDEETTKPENLVQKLRRYHGNLLRTKKMQSHMHIQNGFASMQCANGITAYKNDNYCDCEGGEDEPDTSACSHLLIQQAVFQCRDGSTKIYASRVMDGVKDCPDGSDEHLIASNSI